MFIYVDRKSFCFILYRLFNMQALSRYLFLLFITLFILSFSKFNNIDIQKKIILFILGLVQCQSTLSQTIDRPRRLLRNIDYINMCIFRKTRLCDCKISFKSYIYIENFLLKFFVKWIMQDLMS